MNDDLIIEDYRLLPPPWWTTAPVLWIAAGLAAALAAFLIWRRLGRRALPPAMGAAAPRDWETQYLERLAELRQRASRLNAYELAIACSDLLRGYLECAHGLAIRYQTTPEFLVAAAASPRLEGERRSWLGRYLGFCDLVKFARHGADAPERERLLDTAESFLRGADVGAASLPLAPRWAPRS